jgi:hypothetical protein
MTDQNQTPNQPSGQGRYEDNPSPDSAHYELKDVQDSPVGGHQVQVLAKLDEANETDEEHEK